MPSQLSCDGDIISIKMSKPWWASFFSLPFFAVALYLFYYLGLGLRAVTTEHGHQADELFSLLVLFLLTLLAGAPGLLICSRRSVVISKPLGTVTSVFQIGPAKWNRNRRLSEFKCVEADWEPVSTETSSSQAWYRVSLGGGRGVKSVTIDTLRRLPAALELGLELAHVLDIPFRNDTDSLPDDPDLDQAADENTPSPGKSTGASNRQGSKYRVAGRKQAVTYRLSRIETSGDEVSVLLPPPTVLPLILLPLLIAANCGIWWLNFNMIGMFGHFVWRIIGESGIGGLFQAMLHPAGAPVWLYLCLPVTVAAAVPLLAMAGLKEYLVFDKARREFAVVRKSVLINSRRSEPLTPLAAVRIEPRQGKSNLYPFYVSFLAEPGARPKLLDRSETSELAREFAKTLATAAGVRVVDATSGPRPDRA